MSFRIATFLATVTWCLMATGCGAAKSAATPSADATATAQQAGSATLAIESTVTAATDAILSGGTGTEVTTATDATPPMAGDAQAEAPFAFTAEGTVLIDLDAGAPGHDRFPNATGTMSVHWSGAASSSAPTGSGGVANWEVTVTYASDCVFTDPRCGAQVTVAGGSSIEYALEISWDRADADHWAIASDYVVSTAGWSADVLKGGVGSSAAVTGERHATGSIAYAAGAWTVSHQVTADWTVVLTSGAEVHTVVWHRPSLDRIFITVDGTTYGPYTVQQVIAAWNFWVC